MQTLSAIMGARVLFTSALHHFVDFALNVKLGMLGFYTFQLNSNFLSICDVSTCNQNHLAVLAVKITVQLLL